MLSTIKPIIISLTGLEDAVGMYLQYEVRMQYNSDSVGGVSTKSLYYGKTFVDAYGNTDIQIEKVLRDYLFRWKCKFNNNTQMHTPEVIASSLSQQLTAIEAKPNNLFWNTRIEVIYTYNDTEQTVTIDVCGSWSPAFQKMGNICSSLEGVAITDYVQNYALLATAVPPHIPPKATSKFWLGLVLNINKESEANVGSIAIGADSVNVVDIPYRHGGTYAVAYPLAQLFDDLNSNDIDGGTASVDDWYDDIDGGDTQTAFSGNYDGGTSEDSGYSLMNVMAGVTLSLYWNVARQLYSTIAAVVDTCAKPFYIAWITPTGGWTAYGMDGNCIIESKATPTAITNLRDEEETLSMKEEAKFTLYSAMLKKETYAHLMTMLSSKILYVYDTENDCGWYCNCDTSNVETMPSKTGRLQSFQIKLKSINSNEQ